jgi:hypothetical protein
MLKKVLIALVMVAFIQALLALCLVSAGQLKAPVTCRSAWSARRRSSAR